MADVKRGFQTPAEVTDFFDQKLLRPAFSWQDVWGQEHAYAFTVAKATELELLTAFKASISKALADGQTFETWRAGLLPQLAAIGWDKPKMVADPTGQQPPREVDFTAPRRLQTIFQSNMASARSAGQWNRAQRTKAALPLHPLRPHRLGRTAPGAPDMGRRHSPDRRSVVGDPLAAQRLGLQMLHPPDHRPRARQAAGDTARRRWHLLHDGDPRQRPAPRLPQRPHGRDHRGPGRHRPRLGRQPRPRPRADPRDAPHRAAAGSRRGRRPPPPSRRSAPRTCPASWPACPTRCPCPSPSRRRPWPSSSARRDRWWSRLRTGTSAQRASSIRRSSPQSTTARSCPISRRGRPRGWPASPASSARSSSAPSTAAARVLLKGFKPNLKGASEWLRVPFNFTPRQLFRRPLYREGASHLGTARDGFPGRLRWRTRLQASAIGSCRSAERRWRPERRNALLSLDVSRDPGRSR